MSGKMMSGTTERPEREAGLGWRIKRALQKLNWGKPPSRFRKSRRREPPPEVGELEDESPVAR